MSARLAAAYIRRSSVSVDSPGDASRDAQLAAVRSMCGEAVEVYSDWGISGQKADRPDYVRLKADVSAGKIASVCAYSLSRLGRSSRELLTFVDLCRENGVTIRTSVENLDTSTAMGVAMLTVMAAFAQLEADSARERQASARSARVARGDDMSAPYGYKLERQANGGLRRVRDENAPLEAVLAAYRDAGTVLGACRLLEDRGITAPRGGKRWATSALTRILEREAPELLPRKSPTGQRTPSSAIFAQLLRCPFCDRMLTPNTHRGQYYCANGPRDRATHPRYTVREADILPFLQAEADRLSIPADAVTLEGIEGRRDAILERLARAHELYIAGDIDRSRYEAEKARTDRDLGDLSGQASAAAVAPEIDWKVDPAVVNAALRSMWRSVELDASLRPVEGGVEWIVPEWRA